MPRNLRVSAQEDEASRPRRRRRNSWTPIPDPYEERDDEMPDADDPAPLLPPVDPPQRARRKPSLKLA